MCRGKKCAAGEWEGNHGKLFLQLLSGEELLVLSVPRGDGSSSGYPAGYSCWIFPAALPWVKKLLLLKAYNNEILNLKKWCHLETKFFLQFITP